MLSEQIAALVRYGIDTGLTPACEKIYTTNLLLDLFQEDDYEEPGRIPEESLEQILKELLDEACRRCPPEYWLLDGVHPTPAGHQLIADAWLELFRSEIAP